jgi:hypothetical protein
VSDPIADLKRELVAAAEREQAQGGARSARGSRILLMAAGLGVAAAAASVFVASWGSSPSFLQKAQAALAEDAGVLHATWEETARSTSLDRECAVIRGQDEIWIDQAPPYRYRAIMDDFPPRSACTGHTPTEIGGTFDPLRTLVFEPPGTLRVSQLLFNLPPDPVRVFREALARGAAHDEGETEIDGHTVRRIRIDTCPTTDCPREGEAGYVYLDPHTFYPVEIRSPGYFGDTKLADLVVRYRTFEYLPRTAGNLALTDIQAQHPNAVAVEPSYGG